MAKRTIKRKRWEGIVISGPATVRVSRGVTLVVEASREAQVSRIPRQTGKKPRRSPHVPPPRRPSCEDN